MKFDVFISHTHQDEKHAADALDALEAAGLKCWISTRDINPGAPEWSESIVKAIRDSAVMLVIFSSHANNSDYITAEVAQAFKKLPIVLFRIENVEPDDGLTLFVGLKHWLNAFPNPKEKHSHLVETVKRLLAEGPLPPPPPPPPPPRGIPLPLLLAGGALLALAAVVVAWALLNPSGEKTDNDNGNAANANATPSASPQATTTASPTSTTTGTSTAVNSNGGVPPTVNSNAPPPNDTGAKVDQLIRDLNAPDSTEGVRSDVITRLGELAAKDLGLHKRVVSQLTSFIRTRARRRGQCSGRPARQLPADLQAALDVLATRRWWFGNSETERIDLNDTDLDGAFFSKKGTHFEGVRLRGACLNNAILYGADFRCAYLSGASVNHIDVTDTNFDGADLSNLTGAPKSYIDSLINQAKNLNRPSCAQER